MGPWSLPDAGYYGARSTDGSCIVCDAGPVGPDYLPGHAHGDIFSFELSFGAARVIVDSGVHDYEKSDTRRYCRSTRAHNTVEIDGQDQCEFWGMFYVGRRGRPHDVQWTPSPDGFTLEAWHDGYRHLPGRPVHHRRFAWNTSGMLQLSDHVESTRSFSAVSRFHMHPDCRILRQDSRSAEISFPGGRLLVDFNGPGTLNVEDSFYCPRFGQAIPNKCLAYSCSGSSIRIETILRLTR